MYVRLNFLFKGSAFGFVDVIEKGNSIFRLIFTKLIYNGNWNFEFFFFFLLNEKGLAAWMAKFFLRNPWSLVSWSTAVLRGAYDA